MPDPRETSRPRPNWRRMPTFSEAVMSTRYLIDVSLAIGLFVGVAYIYSLSRDSIKIAVRLFKGVATGNEGGVALLEAVDGILLVAVLILIIIGTHRIYVAKPQEESSISTAYQGMTSGKLKEKLSSSLVTASAVYLFKIVVQLTSGEGDSAIEFSEHNAFILGGFHALFIAGYFVIAQSNRLDPHKQPQQVEPEKHVDEDKHDNAVPTHNNHGEHA